MGSNDLDLLARYVKQRDAEALAELADRNRDMVYATCYRLLGDRPDAEDAAQECFLELARHGAAVRTSVAGWLHRVATRTSLAARHRDRARRQAEREAGSMVSEGAAEATWEEIRTEIDRAIDRLPDTLREPVVLRFLQGKTQTEIADELGVSQPAVSMRITKALQRLRKHLGPLGLGLSVAGLATLLETHAVEAAPATLVANLGRVVLAGPSRFPTGGLATSLLDPLASMAPGSKVLGLLAVALTVGAIVQQVTQVPPAANRRPAVQQAVVAPQLPIADAALVGDAPAGGQDGPQAAGPAAGEPQSGETSGRAPRLSSAPKLGRPGRAARGSAPALRAPSGGAEMPANPVAPSHPTDRLRPAGRPPGGIRVAQADTPPAAESPGGATSQPPPSAPAQPAADAPTLYFSPTGYLTIVDRDGIVGTLGIMAFGKGWEPRDQRRALTGFPVAEGPGWIGFAGEITLWQTGGRTLLYTQRACATDTMVELEYDVTFSDLTRIQGFALALDVPRQRFAGDAVVVRAADVEEAIFALPEELAGFRIGTAEGEQVDLGPYGEPLLSIAVTEPEVPLPLRTRFAVLDERLFDLDEYEVQLGGTMAAGQEVSPDTHLSLRLMLEFPQADASVTLRPPETIARPGVRLCRDARVEEALCERVADVVSAAKQAYEELLPDLSKAEIRVCALPVTSWRENIATNRRDTIYLRVRDEEFGEVMRADAGPLGMLCQAVAELYNPGRFPGLDRFIAHRYLVPALVGSLGAGLFAGRHATPLGADGPELLEVITGDAYAPVHPDFAAARALVAIDDKLGLDALLALPHEVPVGMQPDFAGFRAAAVVRDQQLAAAFAAYDQAADLDFADDGTHLIASFEPNERISTVSAHPLRTVSEDLVVTASPGFEVSQSDEWATHGGHSLRVHAEEPQSGMYVAIADPDWELRDFRRFSRFSMDLMLEARAAEGLRVLLMDDIGGAHGQVPLYRGTVSPGERITVSMGSISETPGQRQLESECFNEGFRPGDVALLYIDIPHPTGHPVTLHVDNLRLRTRAPAASVAQVEPARRGMATGRPAPSVRSWERDDVMQLAQAPGGNSIRTPGVTLRYADGTDLELCAAIADVVAAARAALEATFPRFGTRDVNVYVLQRQDWYESTATNRRDSIYIQPGPTGIGEHFRADAGPVAILCQSVAELYTGARIRGLDRYLTHRYLVPAVENQLGPDPVPSSDPSPLGRDGLAMLERITDEEYATIHSDFAAVAALTEIEARLGLDELTELLAAVPDDTPDPFAALRAAAVAKDQALDDAFWMCDAADELELDEDGTCLVASFEADEAFVEANKHPLGDVVSPVVVRPDFRLETSQSDEWATDGDFSLKFEGEGAAWQTVGLWQADWRFGDLTRFSKLEMDLMVEAEEPTTMRVRLHDDIWHGHGQVYLFNGIVAPGEPLHSVYPLDAIPGAATKTFEAAYYDGRFRTSEVTNLEVMFVDPEGPVALYIDNIRLTPRTQGDVWHGPVEVPAAAAPPAAELFGGAFFGFRPPAVVEPEVEGFRGFRGAHGGELQPAAGEAAGEVGGAILWEFDTGLPRWISSPAVGPDGTLYTASENGNVYALDARTGQAKWTFLTGGRVSSTPAIGRDGTVYVGSRDGKVYALDAATGEAKWEFQAAGEVTDSPVLAEEGTLFIGGGRTLYAVDGATGQQIWAQEQDATLYGSPAVSPDGGMIYIAGWYGREKGLYALDAVTGDRAWRLPTQFHEHSTPVVGADGTVYFGSGDDRVYAVDGVTGEPKWEFITGRDAGTPAIGPDGTVYCACDDTLYAIDGATGEELAQFRQKGIGATISSHGGIYVGGERLIALDASLQLLWEFDDGDTDFLRPTIGPDGTIYVGGSHGKVYAIR